MAKNIKGVDISPAEARRLKDKDVLQIERNPHVQAASWNVAATFFLVLAGIIVYVSSFFVEVIDINTIATSLFERQVDEAGDQNEFGSIVVFTFAGLSVVISGILMIFSIIFGVRGAISEETKRGMGILSILTSLGLFIMVIVPVVQFAFSYILVTFA